MALWKDSECKQCENNSKGSSRLGKKYYRLINKKSNLSKSTIEELRNNLAAKEIEMLNQSKLLSEAKNAFEEMNSKREQQLLELETKLHEKNLHFDQQQNENQKFQADLENVN
jgi:hypothetical protein